MIAIKAEKETEPERDIERERVQRGDTDFEICAHEASQIISSAKGDPGQSIRTSSQIQVSPCGDYVNVHVYTSNLDIL